jgi:putative peptidoglycan lipid II flippase
MSTKIATAVGVPNPLGTRYELVDQIPSDPAAVRVTAWRAYDTLLHRQVRLDVHRPGGVAARDFLDSALAAGIVTHPSLASVLDVEDEGEQAFVVSAWVEGTSLARILDDGPLDADAAAALIGEVAAGVAAAHRAGTAVGALRPAHVIVTPSGTVTVARTAAPRATASGDLTALGALLYAALTARWPLTAGGDRLQAAPTSNGRLCSPRQLRAGVPTDLSTLAMRAMQPGGPGVVRSADALATVLAARPAPTREPMPFDDDADPDADTGAPAERSRLAGIGTPLAGVLAIGLIAWLIVSVVAATQDPQGSGLRAASADGQGTARLAGVATHPMPVRSVTGYDPYYAPPGAENPGQAGRADDGSPATAWRTLEYRGAPTFGHLKPGSGLVFDLGRPTAVRAVRIQTPTPGIGLKVLTGDRPDGALSSYRVVAARSHAGATVTLHPTATGRGRYWVVWLTSLTPTSNGQYQGGLGEVTFLQ